METEIIHALTARALTLVCAESCTAGLVADALARVPGASSVFWGSFVSYALDAKEKMLGVDKSLLEDFGAASAEAARAMAHGALERSGADVAVSVTGLAGPEGDGSATPVGAVWVGFCRRGAQAEAERRDFTGSRAEVRRAARDAALRLLLDRLSG
jgi:PncC family amidohydrolase